MLLEARPRGRAFFIAFYAPAPAIPCRLPRKTHAWLGRMIGCIAGVGDAHATPVACARMNGIRGDDAEEIAEARLELV
jgi:hypothetical protein